MEMPSGPWSETSHFRQCIATNLYALAINMSTLEGHKMSFFYQNLDIAAEDLQRTATTHLFNLMHT